MTDHAAAALVVEYENALNRMMDENAALRAEIATLIDWINGDADALTTLQGVYLNPEEPASNRIRAAAAAIGFERPKLATSSLVVVDFRERVRQARLRATTKVDRAHRAPARVGLDRRRSKAYRHTSLNGSGDIAVYLTVFVIEAWPRKCWSRRVSMPLFASA
jgi:hypothetical protein